VQKGSASGFSRGVTLSHGGKVSTVPPTPRCGVFLNSLYLNHLATRQEIPNCLWEEVITMFRGLPLDCVLKRLNQVHT
jgi:hypothetical protein